MGELRKVRGEIQAFPVGLDFQECFFRSAKKKSTTTAKQGMGFLVTETLRVTLRNGGRSRIQDLRRRGERTKGKNQNSCNSKKQMQRAEPLYKARWGRVKKNVS